MNGTKEILVCAATSTEMGACRSGIEASGKSGAFRFLLTGIGPRKARDALAENLQIETSPSLIVSTGFAGAITSDIPNLSWITAEKVFTEQEEISGINLQLMTDATKCVLISMPHIFRQGQSVPDILASLNTPLTVDMESAALARISGRHKIPFMVLRMITDNPDNPLQDALCTLSNMVTRPTDQSKIPYLALFVYEAGKSPKETVRTIGKIGVWSRLLKEGWTKFAPVITQKEHKYF